MEKFLDNLIEAESIINKIDHMLYVTYPLVNDKKLLLKILAESKIAVVKCINYILQYEYVFKRIRLSKDTKENMRLFKVKCAPRYHITTEEVKLVSELFEIVDLHNKAPIEFRKDNKIMIFSDASNKKILEVKDIKKFVSLAKSILQKIKESRHLYF
ncbi:hypothetical protein GF378_01300 [Candidatus Pacearchaeota archaeon]|nr:hypothetical protein [Candidatus Pacearchaeota archaeon]